MKNINIGKIHSILKKHVLKYRVPVVDFIEIQTRDPLKILISTILSARTQDRTTVAACKKLFQKINKVSDLEKLSQKQIEKLIYPVGFYRTKAKQLKELPKVLKKDFGGKIPTTIEGLLRLPGVGRKTANLVVVIAFKKPGVCVDTHVHRIMNRLGYVRTKTPHQTEMTLRKKLPKKYWRTFNSIFVAFGQHLCRPISPYCTRCPIRRYCNRVNVRRSK